MNLSLLAWLAPVFPLVLAAVIAWPLVWVSMRVRSLFLFRARLWRLANKHDGGGNEWLGDPVAQRRELMKFRSLLAWADSYPQARRVAEWARDHEVDLGTVGECGKFFDPDKLAITREPKKPNAWFGPILLFAGYFLLFSGGLLAIRSDAIVSLKSNGHWLSLTRTSARPLFGERNIVMTVADCSAGKDPAKLGADRTVVCSFLGDPQLPVSVSETVAGQRAAGGLLVLLALGLFFGAFASITESREAMAIRAVRKDLAWHAKKSEFSGGRPIVPEPGKD